jgi:hypothetical protein
MSVTPLAPPVAAPVRRVRHQARDAVLLMAFSASTSVALAAGLMLLARLGA